MFAGVIFLFLFNGSTQGANFKQNHNLMYNIMSKELAKLNAHPLGTYN